MYVDENIIKWSKPIEIPELYDKDIDFEIYDEHQFGYDPEELKTIFYGTLRITQNQKTGKWSVFSTAEDHKKIGSLFINIAKREKQIMKIPSKEITSILSTLTFI